MVALVLGRDHHEVVRVRREVRVVEVVGNEHRRAGIPFARDFAVDHGDAQPHQVAELARHLRDAPMPQNPQRRLREHRFDVDPHVPAAGHADAEHLVFHVDLHHPRPAIGQRIERSLAARRLGAAASHPPQDDPTLPVDHSLGTGLGRRRASGLDYGRERMRLALRAHLHKNVEDFFGHWSRTPRN